MLARPQSRCQLPLANKPIFIMVRSRVWLGYRRNRLSNGSWVLRVADGKSGSWSVKIGEANDYSEADDRRVVDFLRAKKRASDLAALGDQQRVRAYLKEHVYLQVPHHGARRPEPMAPIEAVMVLGNTGVEELARLFDCRLIDAAYFKITCLSVATRVLYEPLSPAPPTMPSFPNSPGSRGENGAESTPASSGEAAGQFPLYVEVGKQGSLASIDGRLCEALWRMVRARKQLPAEVTRSALIEYLAAEMV